MIRGWKGIAENGQLIFRWVIQIAWRAVNSASGFVTLRHARQICSSTTAMMRSAAAWCSK